eukprot:PhF_6_TR40181/c0_g7_i1/m.59587
MTHTPRGDADAFEGTPYDHHMSTMCEMDEIFSLYCRNHDTVVAMMGVYESNMTSLPMDSIQCVLAFTDPSGMISFGPADRKISDYDFCLVIKMTGRKFTCCVCGSDSIADLALKIYDKQGIPPDQQRLVIHGQEPARDRTLNQFDFRRENEVWLIVDNPRFLIVYVKPVVADGCLFPTILETNPPSDEEFQYDFINVKDCFGDVPFEQRGNQLLLARPAVCPVPTVNNRAVSIEEINQPPIRMKILRSEDAMAEPILTETTGSALTVNNMTTHFRTVVAKVLGITPLQCSLHIQMQSSAFREVKCSQDLIHPAATNTFLAKV